MKQQGKTVGYYIGRTYLYIGLPLILPLAFLVVLIQCLLPKDAPLNDTYREAPMWLPGCMLLLCPFIGIAWYGYSAFVHKQSYNRGFKSLDKREYDEAIANFTMAIQSDLTLTVSAFIGRGIAWYKKEEYDKAIADLSEAIQIDKNSVKAYTNRGIVRCYMKNYDEAIADFDDALRLDPENSLAFNGRGLSRCNKKEYDKAIFDYNEAIRLNPNDAAAYSNRGEAWAHKKEPSKAVADFEKSMALYPTPWAHRDFARFLSSCDNETFRDGKKALALAEKGLEKVSKESDWEYHDVLAMSYAEVGDFDRAISSQLHAVGLLKDAKYKDVDDVNQAAARLELYRNKKPYRQ